MAEPSKMASLLIRLAHQLGLARHPLSMWPLPVPNLGFYHDRLKVVRLLTGGQPPQNAQVEASRPSLYLGSQVPECHFHHILSVQAVPGPALL